MSNEILTGESLAKFIEDNPQFKMLPINNLLVELLKRELIRPSAIMDAYSDLMQHKLNVAEAHYSDACVTAIQMQSKNLKKKTRRICLTDSFTMSRSRRDFLIRAETILQRKRERNGVISGN